MSFSDIDDQDFIMSLRWHIHRWRIGGGGLSRLLCWVMHTGYSYAAETQNQPVTVTTHNRGEMICYTKCSRAVKCCPKKFGSFAIIILLSTGSPTITLLTDATETSAPYSRENYVPRKYADSSPTPAAYRSKWLIAYVRLWVNIF